MTKKKAQSISAIAKKVSEPVANTEKKNLVVNLPLNSEEQAIIDNFRMNKKAKCPKVYVERNEDNTFKVISQTNNGSEGDKAELAQASMCSATGTHDFDFAGLMVRKIMGAACIGSPSVDNKVYTTLYNGITSALNALKPQDEIEGMLIGRLVALHFQSMEYLGWASNNDSTPEQRDCNINRATKLSRLYNESLESLMRYRRKGEQKVIVQHINMQGDAKAVITANLMGGGGGLG